MDTHDSDWWWVHTGEYVLGLLDEQDTVVLNRVMQHEPEIEKLAANWADWFQPLSDSLPPIEPPLHILETLMHDLPPQGRRSKSVSGSSQLARDPKHLNDAVLHASGSSANGIDYGASLMALLRKNQRQTDRWRSFSGVAVAACLLLILYFFS